jgi:phosphate transport system ATP-binding protein
VAANIFLGREIKRGFGVLNQAAMDREASELLAQLESNISPRALVSSLRVGDQQLVEIAKAISLQAEILIMDEPTSALDPISTAKIEELIQGLKREVTIIIVTHNMQQAARISDKTAFFLMGDLVEFGDTSTVFTVPKEERTERYITGKFG